MRYICILGIALLICMVLKKVFANTEKTDKGFELVYWNLSYRRRFIRDLCALPIVVAVIIVIQFAGNPSVRTIIWEVVLGFVTIAQIAYDYKKWKEEE